MIWDEIRDARCEMRGASISITKFTENWWNDCVFERTEEHRRCSGSEIVKSWSREDVKLKSFTLWLEIWTIRFLNAKIFLSSLCFKEAKLAKFIRFEALWKLLFKQAYFLSQSSRRIGEMIVFLRAPRNIGDVLGSAQVFQFMYVEKNLFFYKEILHFATLHSEWQSFGL